MFSLNGKEYDASGFLHALAEDLLTTPGGWSGVIMDLQDIADNHIMVIRNEVWAHSLYHLKYGGVKYHGNDPSMVPSLLTSGWIQNKSQPIAIHNGKIVDGWRRIRALRDLGWGQMRVNVEVTFLEEMDHA